MRARYLLALVGLAVGTAQAATCAAGSGWTVVAGLGSCVTCLAGSYSTGGDSSSAAGKCQPCPANTYGGLAGATSCTPCAADSDTRTLTGALACTACPRGLSNFGRRDACAACPSGSQFYAPNIIDGTLGALVDLLVKSDSLPNSCRFCPAGAAATSGANCVLCAAGSYAAGVGSAGCTAAPKGSYVAASGALLALPCPYGTYQTQAGQSGCTACPANSGTTSTGASASSFCTSRQTGSILSNGQLIACPAGQTSDDAGANCVSCTGNTISSAAGACTACASGTGTLDHLTCTTIPAGSIIQNGIQTLCAAGTTSNADRTACVACTGNTIAASAGSGTCTACPTGKYTSDQINCAPILAGFIFANGKLSACPAGTTSNADNTLCDGCTGNTISALAGTATCSSCPALQYTLDNIACLPIPTGSIFSRGKLEVCPAGSVPDATAAICNACKGNTFALAGSGSCTACPAQQVTTNNIVCNAIPLGSILQGDVVVACGAGTTSDLTQTSCITCTGMQIAPIPGSLCSACPVGQATNNHITCYDIPAGYIIKLDALVSCNAGFTSDPTHATCTECVGLTISSVGSSCQSCGAHEYTADHQTCKPVERGYRIRQVDANEDGDNDPDSNVSTYSVYEACPAGTSSDGQSDCTACTGNTIAPTAGSQCEPCPGTQETTDHITCQAVASGGAQQRRSAMFKRSEQFLCPQGKTACYKYMSKKSPGRRFECIDTQSDVMACGGCREGYEDGLGEARGVDCTVFDDVAEASCVAGTCRYKCPHGWTLTEDKGCVWSVEGAKKRRPSGRALGSIPKPTPQRRLAIKVGSPSDKKWDN